MISIYDICHTWADDDLPVMNGLVWGWTKTTDVFLKIEDAHSNGHYRINFVGKMMMIWWSSETISGYSQTRRDSWLQKAGLPGSGTIRRSSSVTARRIPSVWHASRVIWRCRSIGSPYFGEKSSIFGGLSNINVCKPCENTYYKHIL